MHSLFKAVVLAGGLLIASATAAIAADESDAGASASSQEINPRYLLVDTRGRMVSNEDFPGRFQLITFGYTFCPDVCPTTLAAMAQIIRYLGGAAERLQPIFITVDPARDTNEVLARYTAFFDPRIIGLTGPPELIRGAANHYKVTYRKYVEPGVDPGNYSIDHSAGMYLLGPDGAFIAKFAYAASPQELAEQIRRLMEDRGKSTAR